MARDRSAPTSAQGVSPSVGCFDRTASCWAAQYEGATAGGLVLRERRDKLMRMLEGRKGVLLDVGCGSCVLAPNFVAMGFEYWGIDAAQRMVEEGRAVLDGLGGHACVADTAGLPFADGCFDAVVCLGVIDRVPDPALAAAEMARVVKPGGVIVTSFLNRMSPYYAWRLGAFYPAVRLAKSALAAVSRRSIAPHVATNAWRFGQESVARLFPGPALSLMGIDYYGYNFLVPPLDELFPGTAYKLAGWCSELAEGRLRALGGGFLAMVARAPVEHGDGRPGSQDTTSR